MCIFNGTYKTQLNNLPRQSHPKHTTCQRDHFPIQSSPHPKLRPVTMPYLLVSEAAILIGGSMRCGLANAMRLRPCQSTDGCCASRCHIGTSGLATPEDLAGWWWKQIQIVGVVWEPGGIRL